MIEGEIRALHAQGEFEAAATKALEAYGRELLGFLIATLRNEDTASEVFAQASEDMWRGLAAFEWRCSMRTWLYTLARNAAARFRRSPGNQAWRRTGLSRISPVADRVRSRTLPHLRTEVKDRFAELRESLDPEDQSLLILRVSRRMTWKEIAIVMGADARDDEGELGRASARLRQRFQKIKRRIRQQAAREGLLDEI